jgi:hypothetical protein
MKNKLAVETELEEMKDRTWLFYLDKDGDRVFIDDPERVEESAELWKISPEAVEGIMRSLNNVVECIVDTAIEDLEDVWQTAQCAHNNALTAMAILSEGDDCGDDDSDNDDDAPMPNPDDCEGCEQYDKTTNTCKQP